MTPIGDVKSIKENGDELYLLTKDDDQKKLSMWKYDQSVDDFGVLEDFNWIENKITCEHTSFKLFQNVGVDHKRFLMSCQRKDGDDSVYLHTLENGWDELHRGTRFKEMNTAGSAGHGWRYIIRFENEIRTGDLFSDKFDRTYSANLFDNGHINAAHFWGTHKVIVIGVDNLYFVHGGYVLTQCPVPVGLIDGGSSYTDENLWVLADDGVYRYTVNENRFTKVKIHANIIYGFASRVWHDTYTGELYL